MKPPRYYKLVDRRPVALGLADDDAACLEWGRWFSTTDRHVGLTRFECGVWVSTVFLGLDHRFFGDGPPLLFETMVFELTMEGDGDQFRYSSWDDAATGHAATVRKVKALIEKAGLSTVEIGAET